MVSTPKAPTPPDPAKTAAAQTSTNIATAQANAILGNVNQVTPDGNLTYSNSGNKFVEDSTAGQTYWRGPNGEIQSSAPMTTPAATKGSGQREPIYRNDYGKNGSGSQILVGYKDVAGGSGTKATPQAGWTQVKGYYIPQYTATQTLSPAQQAIKDQTDAASLNLGGIANQQSAFLKDYLSKPVSLDNKAVEDRLMELGRARLDPALATRTDRLQTQLSNQGIKLGSAAYDKAIESDNQSQNDAYNQLLLNGRAQSIQEILTQRNQPLNEISALMSGSQVSSPNFVNAQQPTIPTTDYAGLVNQNYAQQMDAYKQKAAASGGMLGGLFGLASAGITAFSDRRLKRDIRHVSSTANGLPWYSYRYVWDLDDAPVLHGLMSDDVRAMRPEAVVLDPSGFDRVNYAVAMEA